MYLSRTCLATGTGLEGLNKGTTSRVVRRRSGLQRVQWWRELQTLFVVAGDKKEHTSDPCPALHLPLGQDDARVFIAAEKRCELESRGRGNALDSGSGLAVEAVPMPPLGKIHPNLDDLLLHQPTATGTEQYDLDLGALRVRVEDTSDYSSDCCLSPAESECCSSNSSLGDSSDSDSDATDTGGPRRQTIRPPLRSRSCLLNDVKVNEIRCAGRDRRGKDVYVTVLSPPPPPKTLVELRF